MRRFHSSIFTGLFFVALLVILTGCNPPQPVLTPELTPTIPGEPGTPPPPDETASPTLAIEPTEETRPDLAVLWTPDGSNVETAAELENRLRPLVEQAGLVWEKRSDLTSQDISTQLKVVIALPPFEALIPLVEIAPRTQFMAISGPPLPRMPNLTQVGAREPRAGAADAGQQAFIAGVIAAMVTDDWRIGVIAPPTPTGQAESQGFKNGGAYFCGLCRPVYPPFVDKQGGYIKYPISAVLPASAEHQDWQEAAQYLIERSVKTIYLPPGAPLESLTGYLAEAGVQVISGAPYPGEPPPNWVAAIYSNSLDGLEQILWEALDSRSSGILPYTFVISQANPAIFSEARQKLANDILSELQAGYISAGVEDVE